VAARLFFSDNTVIVNFGLINRMDLLERLMNDRGSWCATVASECEQSSRIRGLEAMSTAPSIFGDPLYPDSGAEHLDIEMLRVELAEPGDPIHKHRGEAETIAIISRRQIEAIFVTDDRSAARLADRYGIRSVGTWDLMRLAARVKLVDPDTLWGYLVTLRQNGRGRPMTVHDRASFERWIDDTSIPSR
jgi:predicted nucleic acid-binding protein